jgi:hypothetical protein
MSAFPKSGKQCVGDLAAAAKGANIRAVTRRLVGVSGLTSDFQLIYCVQRVAVADDLVVRPTRGASIRRPRKAIHHRGRTPNVMLNRGPCWASYHQRRLLAPPAALAAG